MTRVAAWIDHPAIAYSLLALLQLRVLWGDWRFRDITAGDTLAYVAAAFRWHERRLVDIVWSPAYVLYFGSLLDTTGDIVSAVWWHRTLMTFWVALGVLAVARAVLPSSVAFLVAAWWTMLESAFNVTVEVHLFALLPLLAAILLAEHAPGRWGRALALGMLVGAGMLVRTEYLATAALVMLWWGWIECRERTGRLLDPRPLLVYAAPILVVVLCAFWVNLHAVMPFPAAIGPWSAWKHTVNVCQVFAAGYRQRHPDLWQGDIWADCHELTAREFGMPAPTLADSPTLMRATLANPWAITEHILWNVGLVGNGLQLGLFNAMSGTVSPDYGRVPRDTVLVPWLSAGLVVLLAIGAWLAWQRRDCVFCRIVSAGPGLAVLIASVLTTGLVLAVERPRPEYIYPLTLAVMLAAGGSLALIGSLLAAPRLWAVVAIGAVLVLTPGYYDTPYHIYGRPFLTQFERFRSVAPLLRDGSRGVLMGSGASGLSAYFGRPNEAWANVYGYDILDSYDGATPFGDWLTSRGISLALVDGTTLLRLSQFPGAAQWIGAPDSVGWHVTAREESPEAWVLVVKSALP